MDLNEPLDPLIEDDIEIPQSRLLQGFSVEALPRCSASNIKLGCCMGNMNHERVVNWSLTKQILLCTCAGALVGLFFRHLHGNLPGPSGCTLLETATGSQVRLPIYFCTLGIYYAGELRFTILLYLHP
jgi:hypothetical protein